MTPLLLLFKRFLWQLAERHPELMTAELIAELCSPEYEHPVTNLQHVEYITSWAKRHRIPFDIACVIATE